MTEYITVGIDLGSVAIKTSIVKGDKILGFAVVPTDVNLEDGARSCLDKALAKGAITLDDIEYIMSTGYGRRAIELANKEVDEIYAKAVATKWLGSPWGKVRTAIDIGGQDSKVLSFNEEGDLDSFVMNTKCAAGTGRFLEIIAQILGVPVGELGDLSLRSENAAKITSTCIVFAESEVISLIARKRGKEDICAGIHESIADRIAKLTKHVGVKEVVMFDGGPAKNIGLKTALEEKLDLKLYVPKNPQLSASLGAALLAQKHAKGEENEADRVKGIDVEESGIDDDSSGS